MRCRKQILGALLVGLVWTLTATDVEAGDPSKKAKKKSEKILEKSYEPGTGWEAYFRNENGLTKELILPPEVNPDKDWMGLTFTEYTGPKLRIAVMQVDNAIRYAGGYVARHEVPLGAIEELVMTSLFRANRFELVERKAAGLVLAEQDFANSDRVSQPTAADIGKVLGVDYQIFTTVNEWTPDKSSMGGGKRIPGLGRLGGGKSKAEVAMSFRVVDSTSAQVLYTTTERATAGNWSVDFAGLSGLGVGMEKKSPINYAVAACVNKGVYKLAMWLKSRPWRGSVVQVQGDKVYLNAGSDKGISMGARLTCLSKGESLIDPETGLELGTDTEAIGSVMVTAVKPEFAIATVVQGCQGLKRGDHVELEAIAEAPPASAGAPEHATSE